MSKNLIIDSNLMLLLVIGAVEGGRHIRNSKRLKAFNKSDYNRVLAIMACYDRVFVTPYIATEVSNLIDLNGYARLLAFEVARNLFSQFNKIDVDLDRDCKSDYFLKFGITDNSLINYASNYFILTNDHRLLGPLYKSNKDHVIPYIRLR